MRRSTNERGLRPPRCFARTVQEESTRVASSAGKRAYSGPRIASQVRRSSRVNPDQVLDTGFRPAEYWVHSGRSTLFCARTQDNEQVTSRTHKSRIKGFHCWLLPVASLILGFASSGEVSGASISLPANHEANSGHRCKCGMDCGSVCCCVSHTEAHPAPRAQRHAPFTNPITNGSGPCFKANRCGGATPPTSSPLTSRGETAARLTTIARKSLRRCSLLAPPASDHLCATSGSRVDDPPESLASV
jgi:hypothetical protein